MVLNFCRTVYKDRPEFKCFKCQEQGHIGKHCPKNLCEVCRFRKPNCECRKRRHWGQGFSSEPKRHERENSWRGSAEYRRDEHDQEENGEKPDELTMSTKMDQVEEPTENDDQRTEQMQEDDNELDLDDSKNDCKSIVEIDVNNEIEKDVNNEIEKDINNEDRLRSVGTVINILHFFKPINCIYMYHMKTGVFQTD